MFLYELKSSRNSSFIYFPEISFSPGYSILTVSFSTISSSDLFLKPAINNIENYNTPIKWSGSLKFFITDEMKIKKNLSESIFSGILLRNYITYQISNSLSNLVWINTCCRRTFTNMKIASILIFREI